MRPPEVARTYASGNERRAGIQSHVEQQGYCTILELSAVFAVSEMTIRRDIQRLVDKGALRGVHGGVTVLTPAAMTGTDFGARVLRSGLAKRAIALRAVGYLPNGGAVALDSGTSTLELARVIPDTSELHIVTPSLAVVNAMLDHPSIEVTCLAGILQRKTQSFSGPATIAAIANLRVRTLFLAASSVTEHGVYCGNDYDAVTKRALVDVADEVILLADSSKFTTSAMVRACNLGVVDRMITDSNVTEEQLGWLRSNGVEVDVVSA